jgi:hypothetical protein
MSLIEPATPPVAEPAQPGADAPPPAGFALALGAGGFVLLALAGGLLWLREGEKLFTDGLIAAIMRCF